MLPLHQSRSMRIVSAEKPPGIYQYTAMEPKGFRLEAPKLKSTGERTAQDLPLREQEHIPFPKTAR